MSSTIDARLVKMVERFIPTIEFCTIGVHFVSPLVSRIMMCSIGEEGYCFYESKIDLEYNFKHTEYIFKTIEEVAQKAKQYLETYVIDDVKVSGFSLLK